MLGSNGVMVAQCASHAHDRVRDEFLVVVVMLEFLALGLSRGKGEVETGASLVGM